MNSKIKTSREYRKIYDFYGSQTAKRSGVPLINHIDEGIDILQEIGASEKAILAYCLHPIVQNNEDIDVSWSSAYALAQEYRDRANSYLCRPETDHIQTSEQLKPIIGNISKECLQMLYADKKQNQKDFLIHHKNHNRYENLKKYFEIWIDYVEKELKDR